MKTIEAKVGAFVVICAVILTATIYYVSYVRFKGARVPYRAYLRDAEGMEPGTEVLFGGITVGKVTSVKPDEVDPTRIQISLDVRARYTVECEVRGEGWIGKPDGRPGSNDHHGFECRPAVAARGRDTVEGNSEYG